MCEVIRAPSLLARYPSPPAERMNASDLECGSMRPDEEPPLLDLYRRLLDRGERTATLYNWRVEQDHASGGVRPFVVRHQSAIVGAVSAVPFKVTCAGERISAAWQQDSVVDPRMRGQGLGSMLVELAAEGADVLLAKGTSDAMYRLRLKSGFRDVPRSEYLICVLSPGYYAGGIARRSVALLLFLWSAMCRARPFGSRLRCTSVERFGPEFDELDARLAAGTAFRPSKSSDFLAWRYLRCPERTYRILRVDDEDRLRGAIVIQANQEPGGDAWIVDVLCDTSDAVAIRTLLDNAIQLAARNKAGCIKTFSTSAHARNHLFSRGFVSTSSTPRFTYRSGDPFALSPEVVEWNFWHGDGDRELY